MRVASIFLLTLLPLFCKAQKQWDRFSLWLEEGEIIDVRIPAGSRQVRVLFKHEESQEWKVWQTSHIPDDANGSIYFRVPHEIQRSKIRFEWNGYDPLPYSFYTGKSNFSTRASDPKNRNNLLYRAEIAAYSISEDSVTEDDSSEVEESDIWKIVGDYLYFFNQRRGLQIIDLSNPLNPEVRARHRLPASGEQMYVSDNGEFIFLFVRPPHQTWPYQSNLRVLKFKDEEIKEVSDLKLSGFYSESRMVGETLHIVTEEWEATEWKGWNFNYSTVLSSFDLKDPENIEKTSEISTAGAPQVIFSTNEKLAVVTRDPQDYYNGHLVRIYSLSDFSKIPQEISIIKPGGRILDKFKIRISGDTLTLISQAKRNSNWNSRYSLLENFDINTGELLGSLELAERETLYATRFDGDFAYIVTFLRVDPLFIVDLRDPSNPTLLSELIVPGWSEYLEFLDNQLFAVGVENSQVTASLFDVSDKANPFLSQRIYMGNENEFTWSEANYDEKAIGKVPAHGLFFIPYETWSNGNQENKLQILKYSNQLLEKGGEISHPMEVRRSVTDSTGIYLFSISGQELVVSNILDTNNPYEVTRVPLSWPTDKLHIMGDYTLQIEDSSTEGWGWGWGYQFQDQNITLRLTPTDDFDKLIHSYNAGPGRLLGSLVENDLIHLAILKDGNLSVQMLEVDDEKIILLAKTESSLQNTSYGFEMEAFVFGDNLICWATKANTYSGLMPHARRSAIIVDDWYPYPYNSTTVVDVQVFEYEKNLVNSFINRESNSSLSMKASETSGPYLIGNKLIYGATDNIDHYNDYNVVASETNSSLYQIDLTNPELPAIKHPIPSPGLVIGAQHNESASDTGYLYFENQEVQIGNYRPTPWIQENSIYQDFGRSMSVCAYDGTNIYLLTELNLSDTSGPIEINQEASFIAHSERDAKGIDAYKIQENGSLLLIDSIFQSYNIQQLVSQKGILIGKSDNGMHVSENLLEWPKQEHSGNFYLDLQDFSTGEFGLGVATGNYGVEWFNRPDSISQNSSDNPYNFIPPADDDFVTMALVPYYNPTTGNTWIAPTGGWKAPEGWVAGTKEDYETGINLRRSKTSNDWKELTTEYIQIFEADKAPIFFDVNATKAWKYRPSTAIDLQVEELESRWKNQSWFGNFYDLSFPWIYHTELQWLYFSESSEGSFWLWSKELGWIWTQASAFPYCFSNSNEGWLYLDLKDRISLRYYDFKSEDWIKFN